MSVIDSAVGLLAPHLCIACGVEGAVLCSECVSGAGEPPPPRCAGCKKLSSNYKTCRPCKRWLRLDHVLVATVYEGVYKDLEQAFKFDLKREAAEPMAHMMLAVLNTGNNVLLCPVPTAPARIRMRGFDHTKLLVKEIGKQTGLRYQQSLTRSSNTRQLGSSRIKRIDQMHDAIEVSNDDVVDKDILLIDDVTTTGATLAACAKSLHQGGAKSVSAIVYAQKM